MCRPDMTFAVDWALNNNYISIYHVLCLLCLSFMPYVLYITYCRPDILFFSPGLQSNALTTEPTHHHVTLI